MKYNNNYNICFRHSDKNISVIFNLISKVGEELVFEVMASSKMFDATSISVFKATDLLKMQQVFMQIYRNPLIVNKEEIISFDKRIEMIIENDEYGHVNVSFMIKDASFNSIFTEIKTELASLSDFTNNIRQCLNVDDSEQIVENKPNNDTIDMVNLNISVEKCCSINQNFYNTNLFFTSTFITFSIFFTLYDFEYLDLLNNINKKGDFLYYIRPLDDGGVDLSFQNCNDSILFKGNVSDYGTGSRIHICSNIKSNLYKRIVNSLRKSEKL